MSSVKIKVIPYKNSVLREMYGMKDNEKKWKRQMDKIKPYVGERDGHSYSIEQVLIIFARMGVPDELLVDELELKCKTIIKRSV